MLNICRTEVSAFESPSMVIKEGIALIMGDLEVNVFLYFGTCVQNGKPHLLPIKGPSMIDTVNNTVRSKQLSCSAECFSMA